MKAKFSTHVILKGSQRTAPKGKSLKGINKEELMNITVKLKGMNNLPDLLNTSVYKTFKPLTHEEYAEKYSASVDDLNLVTEFAHHAGLSIVKTEANKRTIELRGTIAQMENAFKVKLSSYKSDKGDVFRGRAGQIKIPKELEGIVEGIFGLDTRPIATPKFKILNSRKNKFAINNAAPSAYYPTDIAKMYNFPQNTTGKNQCIAIIELGGGYRQQDILNYFKSLKLSTPKVVAMSIDGGHNNPTTPNSADGEVMLDIEMAAGIAPDTTIVVYFAKNTNKAFLDAINAAVHDTVYKPSIISISWGSAEGPAGGWTESALNAFNQAFQAAATLGITVCAAAGDNGSNDNVNDGKVHVGFPASSPYVLACGGTKLIASNLTITSEVVWHDPDNGTTGAGVGATGGGISDIFPLPDYQANAKIPKSFNTKKVGRGVPDVAGDADPNTGYKTLVDGKKVQVGGTSGVAPMMAGLLALINEKLDKQVGFIHPKLYANPWVCRDIVQGNNITVSGNKGYQANQGWDACTGNGVPDGMKLMSIL